MMRKTIVRTLATSTISGCTLEVVDGVPQAKMVEPVTVLGTVTDNEALKALKEQYGKDAPVTVTSIFVEKDTYEISVEDFLKYAVKVNKSEDEEEQESEEENKPEQAEQETTN